MPRGLLVLAFFVLVLTACGTDTPTQTPVVIVVTATPEPATATAAPPPATDTPVPVPATATMTYDQAHATIQAKTEADYRLTVTAANTAAPTFAARATATARVVAAAQATAAALPTTSPTPLPSYGSTVDFQDWRVSLAKTAAPRKTIYWSNVGNGFEASGVYRLFWVDAKNLTNGTRVIWNDIGWILVDDHGTQYREMAKDEAYAMNAFATLQGRDPQDVGTVPRATAHLLLVFDVAADAAPVQLVMHANNGDMVPFNLRKK
jgi:hypothetical protein